MIVSCSSFTIYVPRVCRNRNREWADMIQVDLAVRSVFCRLRRALVDLRQRTDGKLHRLSWLLLTFSTLMSSYVKMEVCLFDNLFPAVPFDLSWRSVNNNTNLRIRAESLGDDLEERYTTQEFLNINYCPSIDTVDGDARRSYLRKTINQ